MLNRRLHWIAAALCLLSSCSDREITCSSEPAKKLLTQIIGDVLGRPGVVGQMVDTSASHYTLSGIRTTGEIRNGVTCGALLTAEFVLAQPYIDGIKKDPTLNQDVASYTRPYDFKDQPIVYTVERTDDGQMYVELKP